MNILYLILKKEAHVNPTTLKSVERVFQTGDDLETDIMMDGYEGPLNDLIANNYDTYKMRGITHVVIVPDGSTLSENYYVNMQQYIKGEDKVYLPMIQYHEIKEGADPQFKGLLNTCMWKPYVMSNQYGFIGEELAVKQIDTSLYGAAIPLEVIKKYPFKTKIKYYSSFEYISRIIHKGVVVQGVPKVCLVYLADDVLASVPREEKVKHFTACQTLYKTDEDIEVLDANSIEIPTDTTKS